MSTANIPCLPANYGGPRQATEYLVVHYTAGDGDTAEANGRYFARETVGASAHFFVDDRQVVSSVPETHTAWHCGGAVYRHPDCRNGNSIGIELCSRQKDGRYTISDATQDRAAGLIRQLMERYGIPRERVLRHYDVTGKLCPAPMVEPAAWEQFLQRLEDPMTQEAFERHLQQWLQKLRQQQPGPWSQQARAWAEKTGLLRGDGQSMAYRAPVTREELAEILYRLEGEPK